MRLSGYLVLLLLFATLATPPRVAARPVDPGRERPIVIDASATPDPTPAAPHHGLSTFTQDDTVYYGGTVWAPDSNRWEALRGGTWTFSSGVGSNYTEPTQAPKPAGYLHRAEGWYDIDETYNPLRYFRRAGPGVPNVPGVSVASSCVLHGAASMWAGVTVAEANAVCYASGQGYGNHWDLTLAKTFTVGTPGVVNLHYAYAVDAEPSFDYLYVVVDTTGIGAEEDVNITYYTGVQSGTAGFNLVPGLTMRSTPGPVTLKFRAFSDGGYSDEDGSYPTTCGLALVDDITMSGALVDISTFESGSNGWVQVVPTSGPGGAWMNLRAVGSLPPPLTFCRCTMRDSVMVFMDLQNQHHMTEENLAISPWIDLKAGGDVGRPGKFIQFEGYFDLYLVNWVLVQTEVSWYPAICGSTGVIYTAPLTSDGRYLSFGGLPICAAAGAPIRIDYSHIIPPGAEQVRIAVGIWDTNCLHSLKCTQVSNSTPWFDNIRFGVYGSAEAPRVTMTVLDYLQDNFASDGTLNPAAPGRVDDGYPMSAGGLGDTLVARGDGGNQEVDVVFRVRPGPFTSGAALGAWAASRWTPRPEVGAGWYSARMDSAERGGVKTAGRWMGTLHEDDPHFGGGTDTDRGFDGDAAQLSHEIFPDHILTPGGRIDYFVRARYLPPDPRNPGGTAWWITPDTTGGKYLEMEILPSSLGPDTSWNCVLYVDHRDDQDAAGQALDELALTTALGPGGPDAEGTRFDRYDVRGLLSSPVSLGRPTTSGAVSGASSLQLLAYHAIFWSAGSSSTPMGTYDPGALTAYLTGVNGSSGRRFWASGDNLAASMQPPTGTTSSLAFLNNVCGVTYQCDVARLATCPVGSALDSTYCLPLAGVAGAYFPTTTPTWARGNGCPDLRSFDMIRTNAAVPTATRQMTYVKNGAPLAAPYAMSLANHVSGSVEYKTVLDAVALSALRDANGNTHAPARCNVVTPALQRAMDVFDWFRQPTALGLCRSPAVSAVPDGGGPGGGGNPLRSGLRAVTPNPMRGAAQIAYTNARAGGRVRLEVVDVTGRLVRQLLDVNQASGTFELAWDGRDDRGHDVARGLYFVTLTTSEGRASRKVLVTR